MFQVMMRIIDWSSMKRPTFHRMFSRQSFMIDAWNQWVTRWNCNFNCFFKRCRIFFFFFFFFFFRIRILECMILMIRLPNLFYQGIYVSLACALLVSVSALLFWQCLRGLMLSLMEPYSWWSTDISVCGWRLFCAKFLWRRVNKSKSGPHKG